jgi:twitching motility two-component system response regulator PilG
VQSLEQRPLVLDHDQLKAQLPIAVYDQLRQHMTGECSLRVLARLLGRDAVTVARAIAPYLQQGAMRLEGEIPSQISSVTAAVRTARVACVDDSISIQKSVEFFLQGRGYEVRTIANPLKALNELFSFKPDLILLDIAMPRLDGYEVCGMLRKSNIFRSTPVIMLTGKDGHVDRVRAKMAGATEYLTKPFGERELLDIVDKYLSPQAALSIGPRS